MDTLRPDERAAGVISGADPYRELELYLEKVNEEIGEVFDRWKVADPKRQPPSSSAIPIPVPGNSPRSHGFSPELRDKTSSPQPPPRRKDRQKARLCNGNHEQVKEDNPDVKLPLETKSLPSRGRWTHNGGSSSRTSPEKRNALTQEYNISAWSDSLLAEFNSIIANELTQLQSIPLSIGHETRGHQVRDAGDNSPAMKLRISRSRSWENHQGNDSDSSSRGTPPQSPTSETSGGLHQRAMGLARVLRRHRGQVPGLVMLGPKSDAVLVRVASLPDSDLLHLSDKDVPVDLRKKPPRSETSSNKKDRQKGATRSSSNEKIYNGKTFPKSTSSSNEALLDLDSESASEASPLMKTPPIKRDGRTKNARDKISDKLFNGRTFKKSMSTKSSSTDPFPDLMDSESAGEASSISKISPIKRETRPKCSLGGSFEKYHNGQSFQRSTSSSTEALMDSESAGDASPPSRRDGRVKSSRSRSSEKHHNGRQERSLQESTSSSTEVLPDMMDSDTPSEASSPPKFGRGVSTDSVASSPGRTGSERLPVGLHSFLTRLRPGSPEPVLEVLPPVNVATQTSPAMSRSSSFTWVSDCSSSFLLDRDVAEDVDDSSASSSSSEGCASSRDSLSDSASRSGSGTGTPEREEPESGIGTASPPRSKEHRQLHTGGIGGNKVRRQESWERQRRRPISTTSQQQEVWVRQESVETQTASTELDAVSESHSLPLNNRPRSRAVRPQCLPLTPQHNTTAPEPQGQASPSTASLKLCATPLVAELGNKSSSAPLLVKKSSATSPGGGKPEDAVNKRILAQPRSQSERHLAEIEAAEACKWLRAAGFPQYAQMYEDVQFPIDVSGVQKDHPFLDPDSLQSLFRRLHALNRCAKMKVDNLPKNKTDDSDEDDQCALSDNWTFQPESRRWSRVCDVTAQHAERLQALSASSQQHSGERPEEPECPGDRLLDAPDDDEEEEEDYDPDGVPVISSFRYGSLPPGSITPGDSELLAVRFRRTGSERLRDGAKALLRRMESLKSRRRKRQHREGVVISGPQVLDVMTMQQRMKDLNCVDVSPTNTSPDLPPQGLPVPSSPTAVPATSMAEDSSSYCSDGSVTTPPHTHPQPLPRGRERRSRRLLRRAEEGGGALSDSEVQPTSWRHQYLKDANSNHTKVLEFVDGRSRGPQDLEPSRRASSSSTKSAARTGSLNLGKESQRYRDKLQQAFHKEVTVYRDKSGSSELTGSQESSSTLASQVDSDHDDMEVTPRHKAVVVRWHSFQRGSARPDSCLFRQESVPQGSRPMGALSCGQLLVLRKLALLKLTACMERYCPTHRTGWNWELPKFIRKIKAPDYKDKTVFGVPLLLSLQRTGQALPKCIQLALRWLRLTALDQVGLFRKSGVRSRIQKLKQMTEMQGETISYEGQQAYDVADMVKQYFRELPEALLTNKLSETFIAIFQHVPGSLRAEAVQCVLLLLPDEHREALQTLLEFLQQVAAHSTCNQMTASNLAVCLAPSLFHLHHAPPGTSRSASASPRRRKTVGVPDPRELSENKAAHDCLLYLIREHKELFVVSEEMLAQCHFNYMEESIPVALEELGTEFQQDWRGYLYACTSALLKEAREKSRGWVSVSCPADPQVDMAYKKVGDGHPLRLWRVSTEVEAPPQELLQRVLRERHAWDYSLLKWRVVVRLDPQVEVFQYVCASMPPLAAKDYCVLRSWRSDLPKGACVIVETSVEHADGPVMLGGVRGIVLASRYLIEPCGSGKSRIMHLSRVDTKGRTPEWYNKSYGHICALHLARIRTSFKHNTDGPESKV